MPSAYNFGRPPVFKDVKMVSFKGVDFANDYSEVALQRSPDAKNVMSSYSNVIEKRTGYEVDYAFNEYEPYKINSFHIHHIPMTEDYRMYAHVGTELWYYDSTDDVPAWDLLPWLAGAYVEGGTPTLFPYLEDKPTTFVEFPNGRLYLIGASYWANVAYDQGIVEFVVANGIVAAVDLFFMPAQTQYMYVPTTVIARAPTGGGTPYDAISKSNKRRKNSFLGVAATVAYQLDATILDASADADKYGNELTGVDGGYVVVEILQSDGTYHTLVETTDFDVERSTGIVTFHTAPGTTPITGQDNVIITFAVTNEDNYASLSTSTAAAFYGFNGSRDYVFFGGNAHYMNEDYQGFSDDFYFPETGYTNLGNDYNPIMGYGRFNDAMIIYKGHQTDGESGVYLRTADLDNNNEIVFPVSQGISNVGAISGRCIASLRDDPLWLCDFGIVALITNNITNVRSVQERGYLIHKKLLAEPNLLSAISAVHDNRYIIAVPTDTMTHVYVADPRKKYTENKANSESWQYEWYYWEFPTIFSWIGTFDDVLYFGTTDGKLCHMRPASDGNAYYDDETPVMCYWKSPLLYMDDITAKKTLKNFWCRMVQNAKSSVKIYYNVRGSSTLVKEATFDMFSFEDINFERFTFDTDDNAEVLVTNRMERQFMAIQFMLSSTLAESFGLIEMVARYRTNSTFKGGM
jgi:hypothetical protein